MCPTDVCHPNEKRVPVPRQLPARFATFVAANRVGVLGSSTLDRGTGCFTTPRTASADHLAARAAFLPRAPFEK